LATAIADMAIGHARTVRSDCVSTWSLL